MYQFISVRDESILNRDSKLADLDLYKDYNEVLVYGKLLAKFGQPVYETNEYDNAYYYIIQAKAEDDTCYYFSVYQGPSGCAIGAENMSNQLKQAIIEFKEMLREIKPVEYIRKWEYSDYFINIKCGIRNGEVFYEETDIED